MKSILVPVDFSETTERVLQAATNLAMAVNARVSLLNVAPREADVLGQQLGRKVITEPIPEELRERYDKLIDCAKGMEDTNLVVKALLERGDRVPTILAEAERQDADCIVMGSHGRGGLFKRIVGSVSEGVLRDAKCPILIIPSKAVENKK